MIGHGLAVLGFHPLFSIDMVSASVTLKLPKNGFTAHLSRTKAQGCAKAVIYEE